MLVLARKIGQSVFLREGETELMITLTGYHRNLNHDLVAEFDHVYTKKPAVLEKELVGFCNTFYLKEDWGFDLGYGEDVFFTFPTSCGRITICKFMGPETEEGLQVHVGFEFAKSVNIVRDNAGAPKPQLLTV